MCLHSLQSQRDMMCLLHIALSQSEDIKSSRSDRNFIKNHFNSEQNYLPNMPNHVTIFKWFRSCHHPAMPTMSVAPSWVLQNYNDLKDSITAVEVPKLISLPRDLSKKQQDFSIQMLVFIFVLCFVLFLTFKFTCKNIVRISFLFQQIFFKCEVSQESWRMFTTVLLILS